MDKNIKTQVSKIIGQSLSNYDEKLKPIINEVIHKEEYQQRIIDCMVGEVEQDSVVINGEEIIIPFKREIKNQGVEVLVNELDVEYNIIPYLMDMEFNLMVMED